MIKIVSVFGTGRAKPGNVDYAIAKQLGRLLAKTGYSIANGGYGGTMEASARGAAEMGGEVIGVTCLAFGRGAANKYVSREVVTRTLNERLDKLIELGDAYVVLAGGTGTLLELAMVWELKNKGFLDGRRPIIILGEYWGRLVEEITAYDPDAPRHLILAKEPIDVIKILKRRRQTPKGLK
ncbi:MAG: LOG family protein [Sedimentisphaerales bacterium]|nr:LOG family protein [Sedimentisphaerales bacterium]